MLRTKRIQASIIVLVYLIFTCTAFVISQTSVSKSTADENFKVTTVFLIRHAEKADAPREDPSLNDMGKARSQALANMLGQSEVKAIYTSQYLRTKLTGEPLAKQLGLTVTPLQIKMSKTNPREISVESTKEVVDKIYERAGEAALVIGHSNTIPEVIKMLGGDVVPTIDEQKFDDLFVVTVYGKGKAKVVRLKY